METKSDHYSYLFVNLDIAIFYFVGTKNTHYCELIWDANLDEMPICSQTKEKVKKE
jgi:hypothetical protein